MKIKVLHVINRYNVGGISNVVANLCKSLSSDFDVSIIGGKHSISEKDSSNIFKKLNLNFHVLNTMSREINFINDLISIQKLILYIIKVKPNIVHTHASKAGFLGRLACQLLFYKKIKIVHTYHGNVFEGYFSIWKSFIIMNIERFLAYRTNVIVALSLRQKNDLVYKYKICKYDKIVVIPIGLNLSSFINFDQNKLINARNIIGIEHNKVVLTTVGRLVPIKNLKLFIDIALILKNKLNNKFVALVVGDGSEKENLMLYAKEVGLTLKENNLNQSFDITFTSWCDDLPLIYACSNFVLLTSLNEGTPVSIIEAMASKKVVLSTNVGGIDDLIPDGIGYKFGFDANEFADTILHLTNNFEIVDTIGKNAQHYVVNNYHSENMTIKTSELYKSII